MRLPISLAMAAVTVLVAIGPPPPAHACIGTVPGGLHRLDVTYRDPVVVSGPISFGLSAMPDFVDLMVTFQGQPDGIIGRDDVASFSLPFGDATWTEADLGRAFQMELMTSGGVGVLALFYETNPITTPSVLDGLTLNFPLTITGTDIASGEAFEYRYDTSTETLAQLAAVPEPTSLAMWVVGGIALIGFGLRRRKGAVGSVPSPGVAAGGASQCGT